MAGLPCDACQEETVVLNGEAGQDGDGANMYRRYRVCINPTCERYMLRRESAEIFLEVENEIRYRPADVKRILRATGPQPADEDSSQPSLFAASSAPSEPRK